MGITVEGTNPRYVFLYFAETNSSGNLFGNRIYRYEWDSANKALTNTKLVLDLPAIPGPVHNEAR